MKCGKKNDSFGETFTSGISWPWMVSIGDYAGDKWIHHCGGSLIDNIHVLTAASCVYQPMLVVI